MMRAASGVAGEDASAAAPAHTQVAAGGCSEDVDVGSVDGDGVQSDDKDGDVIKGGAHV